MPKITPSALISEIKGKWHGDCFQMWKNKIVARRSPRTRRLKSQRTAFALGEASDIAGCYDALLEIEKTSWICYAETLPDDMSGFNAFFRNNTTLVLADHPALHMIPCAPDVYHVPPSPNPYAAQYCSGTGYYCTTWATPTDVCYYVQAFYGPQTGWSNLKSTKWRHLQTVTSGTLHIDLDGSPYAAGQLIRFRARTLDAFGQPSPFTDSVHATKT